MARIWAVLALLVLHLCSAAPAIGLTGQVTLGFCEPYRLDDGSEFTHRGIDVTLAEGAEVEAPRPGQVRFAGRVPGPHGGSVLAVTLETADGTVTMLPFDDVCVETGEQVEESAPLGHLGSEGDPSSDGSHLHLGLKRSGVYVDPSVLLAVAAPAASTPPADVPVESPVSEGAGQGVEQTKGSASAVADSPAPSADPVAQTRGTTVLGTPGVDSPAAAEAPSAVSSPYSARPTSVPREARLAPGVTLAPQAIAADVRAAAEANPLAASKESGGWTASLPFSNDITAPAIGVVGGVVFLSALLITRRSLARRVTSGERMSDRLGTLLQHLKAGDTLCGLTSCSGPLPSQSRGH